MKIHRTHRAFDEYSLNGVPFDDQASRSMNIHRTSSAFDESFIQRALLHDFFVSIFLGEFEYYHLVYMSGGKAQLSAKPKCTSKAPVCEQGPTVSVALGHNNIFAWGYVR